MSLSTSRVVLGAGLAIAVVASLAVARTALADTETGNGGREANMAAVAAPSASAISGDTNLAALRDGLSPRNSRDRRQGVYGNWPRGGTQWVQYEWPRPIATNRVAAYWWDDNQGVRLPVAARLLYWDGSQFVPVPGAQELDVEANQYNSVEFPEITTTKLRLEMDARDGFSTGLHEWKVFDSGASPEFPPVAEAGVDRVVVVGGQTFLHGKVSSLKPGNSTKLTWSQVSGPGEVQFADPKARSTTARVTAPGKYVLQLTAGEGELSSTSSLQLVAVTPPTEAPMAQVPVEHYQVSSPFWKPRIKSLIVSWIPHCYSRISELDLREGGINNFVEAGKKLRGEPSRSHRGYVFSNAWVYNTVESMCLALMVDAGGDQEIVDAQTDMRAKLEEWIPIILAAQEPNGYLQTLYTLSGREPWTVKDDHEGYVAGYFLEAAIAHHRFTEGMDSRLYDAAKRLADCWCDNIGPSPKKAWYDGHQEMEMALARFGRYVNEFEGAGAGDRYLALSKFLLDQRGGGTEYDQSHLPAVQQYEAVGHAVRAVYSYAGMADVVIDTGDPDYLSAVESLWDNIVNRKYYVTGGVGSGETSEGFGPDYSLRNNAYCESCSGCGELFFQHKLNSIRQDAKYADLFETTLYNAILGDIDLQGENFYYQNPLDARRPRYPWHGCPCCIGNIPRTLLSLPTWTYATNNSGVVVNLYIGSTMTVPDVAEVGAVELVQETNYPWKGGVAITVNPAKTGRFTIRLRVPNRDVSELYTATPEIAGIDSLKVNNSSVDSEVENGYLVLSRDWKAGDKIEFELPMEVQKIHGSDKVAAIRGLVALRYGPMIYNLESVDQELDKAVASDAKFKTEWYPNLLEGVVAIEGQFADGSKLFAIPNYARMNRVDGRTRSIVWIREAVK